MTHLHKLSRSLLIATFLTAPTVASSAGAGQGGRDILHVPLSWCAVQGSPAAAAPNILGIGATTPDTTTDAVLWRRHERPTDNITLPPADITFRSAINNAWGTLNFPIIADPNTALGVQGDVRGESNAVLGAGSEFATLIQNCDAAWAGLGRAGIGITAVNVNLFHDGTGNYFFVDAAGNITGGTPIGWGGCVRPIGSNVCTAPYDGRIMVADNNYLYPTVADRSFPPSPLDPAGNVQYTITDPLDQLVGHELGHALGLDHAPATTDLMFGQQQDNDADLQTDNIFLDATEVNFLRQNAQIVPGLEIDPPNQIDPGNFVGMTLADDDEEERNLAPHLDITSVNATLDKAEGVLFIDTRLRGVTPQQGRPAEFIVGLDVLPDEGLSRAIVDELGLRGLVNENADVLVLVTVAGERAEGRGFIVRDGELISLDRDFDVELRRLTMYPHYTPVAGQQGRIVREDAGIDIYDSIAIRMAVDEVEIKIGQPFDIAIAATDDRERFDIFDVADDFVLEDPSFPHCFVQEPGVPGGTAETIVEDLLPSLPFHALVGPDEVYRGVTDADGGITFDLPIPVGARPGPHLVTVGIDDTALTADCVVQVVERHPGGDPDDDDRDDYDRHDPHGDGKKHGGYFDALDGYRQLLQQIGHMIGPMVADGDRELLEAYWDLVEGYGEFLMSLPRIGMPFAPAPFEPGAVLRMLPAEPILEMDE